MMKEMAKCVPDAGLYAPVTVLVDGRQMVCTLLMTKWQAYSLPMVVHNLWPLLRIWIPKSSDFFEKRLNSQFANGHEQQGTRRAEHRPTSTNERPLSR